MKNKKKGFTIIELILAILITVIILSTILTIFIVSTKIFTNVDVKSTLQSEAETAQEKISKFGMQANGITIVNGNTVDSDTDSAANYNITNITIMAKEEVQVNPTDPKTIENVYYTITYEKTGSDDDLKIPRGKLTIQRNSEPKQVIGEDVDSITMKPGNPSGKLSQVDSVEFTINLAKKRGFSDVKYSIPINVTFRNKTSY